MIIAYPGYVQFCGWSPYDVQRGKMSCCRIYENIDEV